MTSRRYSIDYDELWDDARQSSEEERLEDELSSFARLIEQNPFFKSFFEDPRVSKAYKKRKFDQLCPENATHHFKHSIFMLIEKHCEDLVDELAREITRRLSKERGILFGEVESMVPIPEQSRIRLNEVLTKVEKKPVRLRFGTNPEILGGLSVRFFNGEVWDVSLRHRLNDICRAIMEKV